MTLDKVIHFVLVGFLFLSLATCAIGGITGHVKLMVCERPDPRVWSDVNCVPWGAMTVYVDDVRHQFGRMKMCHMWADTDAELHAFATLIGIKREWFQEPPKASWNHYDISLSKKKQALAAGAQLTDKYGPIEHCARLGIASGIPARVAIGNKRLEQVRACRGLSK